MEEKFKITESEWQIMKVLWQHGAMTSKEMMQHIPKSLAWKENTVKTLLSRLAQKAIINYEKEGRFYKYFAVYSEAECIQEESKKFLNRVFDGMTKKMMASFLKQDDLSKDDLEELKAMLDERLKE